MTPQPCTPSRTPSFVQDQAAIQDAFVHCVGGLLSIAVQEVRLAVTCLHRGVQIQEVKSVAYDSNVAAHGRADASASSTTTKGDASWCSCTCPVLTQNQHLAPSTQQAEQSWLNTRDGSEACQSIFLKLTKDEK
jgi:hypothetical protein